MEWTEVILGDHADILNQGEINSTIGISRYSYNVSPNVMKTFIELWSPLTNTLHFDSGEMSISLHDLENIEGLPISRHPYEEFLPPTEHLLRKDEKGSLNRL